MGKSSPYSNVMPPEAAHKQIIMFSTMLPGFKTKFVDKKLIIFKYFSEKELEISITTPYLELDIGARIISKLPIEIALKRRKEICAEIRTRMQPGWESSTTRKINALIDAIKKAPECPECKNGSYPTKNGKNAICFRCENCGKSAEPKYGLGFSYLNSCLIKK
jgi:hypothetical protein